MIDTTLKERYRIVAELGRGGMGIVYRAYDTLLKRDVAVKVLSAGALAETARTRLLVEAQAVAQLNHPNIVAVYDAGEAVGLAYIVMEVVDGPTLRAAGQPSLADALRYARQIGAALAHAHEHGIIHRDLKLENAMVSAAGTVKLMDFGLARSAEGPRLTEEGALVGTAAYLAPELISGGQPSPQSDLYAFGVMLYELLTGRPPFTGDDIVLVLGQQMHAPVVPPRTLNPAIPPEVDALVVRLLSKRPEDRPASVAEALGALDVRDPGAPAVLATTPILHVQLLGDFQLIDGDKPLTAINQPRQQALLAYLLLHRHAPQSRQHLAFTFWPDTGEDQALTNLRNLLHKLRQNAPQCQRFLHADAQTVQWRADAPYTLDVADFEAAAGQTSVSHLERAVHLYHGDLLPGCFDDWITPERTRLQQMAMAALERLSGLMEKRREYRAAIGYAERLRQIDPLNEAAYRALMHLHAANNDRAGALRVYHTCVRMLRTELDVDPAAETRDLYQRLLRPDAAPQAPSEPTQDQPPLVGRQSEWTALQNLWRSAAAGQAHCVILYGEPGIGKTRLAEELLSWARRQGYATATAHCYAAEGALAYAPVAAWLRSPAVHKRLAALEPVWLTEVARLLPELLNEHPNVARPAALSENWQRQRLFDGLAHAMLRTEDPLLLFLDDGQWCDRDTLEWLNHLLHFRARARLLIVATLRTEDADANQALTDLLATLRRSGESSELALLPLDETETASLAAHMTERALTSQQAARLYQETEGNPLFVVEMMRSGQEVSDEEPPAQDRQALTVLPPKVNAVLQSRLAYLSPSARELAGLAAAIGREFTFGVLARASSMDEDTLVGCLDELWQRRIVRERGADAYDFTHDKLRQVAYASLSAARRRLLHRRVAEALEAADGQALDAVVGVVAAHYELAGLVDRAIPYYQRAAETARRVHATGDAIRYYRRALALLEGPAQRSPGLSALMHEQVGDILHFTGQYEEARTSYGRALAQVSSVGTEQGRLRRKVGNTWREQYQYADARLTYAQAEQALGAAPLLDRPGSAAVSPERTADWWQEWIQIRLEMSTIDYWLGQFGQSVGERRKLQSLVEQYGAPGQRATFLSMVTWTEFRRTGSVASDEALATMREVLAAVRESGDEARIPSAQFGVGMITLWHGDPSEAIEPMQAALRLAEATADITLQARCLTYLAVALRQIGRLDEVDATAQRALNVSSSAHMPEYVATSSANLAWVAWRRGDISAAEAHGRAALASWQKLPAGHASAPFQWTALWPLIAVALHDNQPSAAIEHARRLLDPAQQRVPGALAQILERAIDAWQRGERETAQALLQQAMALAQQMRYL